MNKLSKFLLIFGIIYVIGSLVAIIYLSDRIKLQETRIDNIYNTMKNLESLDDLEANLLNNRITNLETNMTIAFENFEVTRENFIRLCDAAGVQINIK